MTEKSTVCLVMMVRDEAAIIERCLLSVRDHIDHWLIADTGSTDDTAERIDRVLAGIPGEMISLPWTDFATVRNQLRQQSRGRAEFVLWLDADETVFVDAEQAGLNLDASAYELEVHGSRGCYSQTRLTRDDCSYCFSGSVAEVPGGIEPMPQLLDGVRISHHEDGYRWRDAAKNQRDILLLKSALLDVPKDPRLVLALADSHSTRGELVEALHYYQQHAALHDDPAKTWYALYQAGRMMDELGFDTGKVVEAYFKAYDFQPEKIEPLVRTAKRLRLAGQLETALDVTLAALETEQINYVYFHEPELWRDQRFLEYLRINTALNCYTQVIDTSEHLLSVGELSLAAQKQVKALREEALQARSERPESEAVPGQIIPADHQAAVQRPAYAPSPVPTATPRREKRKLCIGMCTFDDYDGVYFSIQAIRMYHPEVLDQIEILLIDNNPTGPCASPLKALDGHIDNYRYVPLTEVVGTAARDYIFREANADFVLVMDCHVLIVPGALKQLIDYLDANPDTNDLFQGPLVYDDLKSISTHFSPGWRGGMWGTWESDPRGQDLSAEPFDIPMMGLGLFGCRREAWPGFNSRFRGFGAEEGYIHEKVRQAGGRTLCLPFLRWMHRFNRPLGVPYPIHWETRVRNYMIGWHELGLELASIREHFAEILGVEVAAKMVERIEREIQGPLFDFDEIYFYTEPASAVTDLETEAGYFEQLCISDRVIRPSIAPGCPDPESTRLMTYKAIIEKARSSKAANVLIIENLAAFADVIAGSELDDGALLPADYNQTVVSGDHSEDPAQKLTAAIAINRRVFDQLLAELPAESATAADWLGRRGSLERFLQGQDNS